ncbi:unnamed protein product, partial [Ectocarpus sp. 12 AP-2014]
MHPRPVQLRLLHSFLKPGTINRLAKASARLRLIARQNRSRWRTLENQVPNSPPSGKPQSLRKASPFARRYEQGLQLRPSRAASAATLEVPRHPDCRRARDLAGPRAATPRLPPASAPSLRPTA